MIILGIDPGTVTMGYGVIEDNGDKITLIGCGALGCPERSPLGERLNFLYGELGKIMVRHRPDAVAIEQPFVAKNVKSALAIGKAHPPAGEPIRQGTLQGAPGRQTGRAQYCRRSIGQM